MISKAELQKKWLQTDITNDFVFTNVMLDRNNLLYLIQAILPNENIVKLRHYESQRELKPDSSQKGSRLDLFAIDDQGKRIDIELQVENKPGLGKRMRYYQAKMDQDALLPGQDYQALKKSYVIFLCPTDPFHLGYKQYTFLNYCREQPSLQLETESYYIVLNAKGTKGKVSFDLQSFYDIMNHTQVPETKLSTSVLKSFKWLKRDKEKERAYMSYEMALLDAKRDGIEEERIASVKKTIIGYRNFGASDQAIIKQLVNDYKDELSKDQIIKMVEESK